MVPKYPEAHKKERILLQQIIVIMKAMLAINIDIVGNIGNVNNVP